MRTVICLAVALVAASVAAQDDVSNRTPPDVPQPMTAEQIVDAAHDNLRPKPVSKPCPRSSGGEIVVCAEAEHDTGVPSSLDDATAQGLALPDGKPRAPDVFGIRPCNTYLFCSKVGGAPRPVYMIDLKAIPEAPPGSDAARYKDAADADAKAADAMN